MILVDTSAWIDYLRAAGTQADEWLTTALETPEVVVVMCEPVAMEVLAGPTADRVVTDHERLVDSFDSLDVDPALDFRAAAAIYRDVRRSGRTPRSMVDCLIAGIALRHGVAVAHKDEDFEVIAELTGLRTISLL